jgi:hypothetical protein
VEPLRSKGEGLTERAPGKALIGSNRIDAGGIDKKQVKIKGWPKRS